MALVKLLHSADFQIGKLFGQFEPHEASLLAEARLLAVERLAALAVEQTVDLILVAGDVFDAQTVTDKTIHQLFRAMEGFSGTWILIPGNHDAALAESVWTRAARLRAIPGNVRVSLKPELILLDQLRVAVLTAPLTQRHTHEDLTEWFDEAETEPAWFRIGMAHGSVQGILPEDIDSPNPIAQDRAARARLNYLALGDWHGMKRIDARTWYSGTPETDRFRANDSGHALLVELEAPGLDSQITPLDVGSFRWREWERVLVVATDLERLEEELAALGPKDVVSLRVSGSIDWSAHTRLTEELGRVSGQVRCLVTDLTELRIEPTAEDVAELRIDGYLGEVVSELWQAQEGVDARVAKQALLLLARFMDELPSVTVTKGEA